jgi:isoquinoline 1-oxidoreductase beta subunit
MVGYLIAGPTLLAGARWAEAPAQAVIPSVEVPHLFDLSDLLNLVAGPTSHMITVKVNKDGTVSFALPRAEVGQGITTACAMVIADEMDLPIERVKVSLADGRPGLLFNQLTGGSNSMHSIYTPVRTAAATARAQLQHVASRELRAAESDLKLSAGVFTAPDGRTATFGSLAEKAAVSKSSVVRPRLKPRAEQRLVGTEQKRIDAHDIVTGRKQFAMDLDVPNALPTMLARPPWINGRAVSVANAAAVRAMPGITDVVIVPHSQYVPGGVAVRGKTFGQCIDAVRALDVKWSGSPVAGKSTASVLKDLKNAQLPLTPALPGSVIDETFTFHFRPGDPLETNCAIADVRKDRAEVWSSLKSPLTTQQQLALILGLQQSQVKAHVTEGGGSFGRHLFSDAAFEAAIVSQKLGKPVKLMWHRTDNFRQGRVHPMCTSRVRVTHNAKNVLAFDQRHTSVATDFTHGFGELITGVLAEPPKFNLGYSQVVFNLTANVPYNFGVVDMAINEVYAYNTFNTSSVRNIYSPEVRTSIELLVDQLAKALGKDPLEFRLEYARDARMRAVLRKVKKASDWGRALPAGVAQGVGVHREYKGFAACVVEVDARPKTVNRKKVGGKTGPRVRRVTYVVDVGLPINPLGLKAQMMGGIMDGIGQVFTYCLHLKDGAFLEASWDNAFYTRQWNAPPRVDVIVMPQTADHPGGAGEFGVAASMAAAACAYSRAVGKLQTEFPVTYHDLGFKPYPFEPPIPASPRNGLKYRKAPKQHH